MCEPNGQGFATPEVGRSSGEEIRVLHGVAAIRLRPRMYIGSVDSWGLLQVPLFILEYALCDDLGACQHIEVVLGRDGSLTVAEDGPGLPVDLHADPGALAALLTEYDLHSRVVKRGRSFLSHLNSVANLTVVNALSSRFEIEVRRDGSAWRQRFARGAATSALEHLGPADQTGTRIALTPDAEIFKGQTFDADRIAARFQELAFLLPHVHFSLRDETRDSSVVFHAKDGLADFVRSLNSGQTALHDPFLLTGRFARGELAIALQYREARAGEESTRIVSFVMRDGGVHVKGFQQGLALALSDWARRQDVIPWTQRALAPSIAMRGVTAVISILLRDPQFMGSTWSWLGEDVVRKIVKSVTYIQLSQRLEENTEAARRIFRQVTAVLPEESRS